MRGQKRPLVRQQKICGEIETLAEHRTDKQQTDANKRESESNVFEERVRLRSTGDVYHPDFINYDVLVGAGLAQENTHSDDVSGWNNDTLDEYLASVEILRTKPYSATLNASKTEDLIPRQFLGPLRVDRQGESASVFLRPDGWPMTFQYSNSDTTQDGFTHLAPDFFGLQEQRFRYTLDHDFSKLSHLHFGFDRTEARQESTSSVVNTDTDTYTLSHDYLFGKDGENRLDSLFNYIDQTGSFLFKDLRWQERLKLQHTPSLLSRYDLQYNDLERESLSSKQIRGQAGLEHRLFDSLVTNVDAFASQTDLGQEGDLAQYGGILGLSYRKTNPWGLLLSSYSASFIRSDQTGGAGKGAVVGEAHTATDLVPIELDRTNLDLTSIRVRDSVGNLFQQGDDYTVFQRDGKVFLTTLVVGGVIPPNFTEGQEFFVDYEFFVEPERQEDTLRQNFLIRERFQNGLSVYYGYRAQQQSIRSTMAEVIPDEYTVNTIGADYTNKGLFLLAEYSNEESTLIPLTSTKLEGRYQWMLGPATSASVGLMNQWLDFGPPDARQVTLLEASAEVFSRLTDNYSLSTSVEYRDEDDTRFGITKGFQIDSKLEYQYRQFSATVGAELDFLERRNDRTDGIFFYIRALRRF